MGSSCHEIRAVLAATAIRTQSVHSSGNGSGWGTTIGTAAALTISMAMMHGHGDATRSRVVEG